MLKTETLKAWLIVHKWSSLVCTAFLLLLCVTGLPLIFWHEIDEVMPGHVEPPVLPVDVTPVSLDSIVGAARNERPSDALQFVSTDDHEPNVWYVAMGETPDAPEVTMFFTFDARTGAVLDRWTPSEPGVMDFIFRLHYDLFVGLPGTLFMGSMGLLFVIALVSGAVVYGPFMRKLAFGTIRRDRSARTRWLDLHNLLGIGALLWLLVVGATGVINTLALPIYTHWQNTELAGMVGPYREELPDPRYRSVDLALAAAREEAPGMELSFIAFPGNEFAGPHHYVAYMRGATPLTARLLTPLLIDGRDGTVIDRREMPWYVKALLLSQPLHFGDYGGLPLKALWALLDCMAIIVLGSGLYLWLRKRSVSLDARLAALQAGAAVSQPIHAALSGRD